MAVAWIVAAPRNCESQNRAKKNCLLQFTEEKISNCVWESVCMTACQWVQEAGLFFLSMMRLDRKMCDVLGCLHFHRLWVIKENVWKKNDQRLETFIQETFNIQTVLNLKLFSKSFFFFFCPICCSSLQNRLGFCRGLCDWLQVSTQRLLF